jgi:hypothetical protein
MSHHLVFGVDRDPGVPEESKDRTKSGTLRHNPLLAVYGPGPEGMTCGKGKGCAHLYLQGGVSGHYLKCSLRLNTSGPGTDHRSRWPACGRYVARVGDEILSGDELL